MEGEFNKREFSIPGLISIIFLVILLIGIFGYDYYVGRGWDEGWLCSNWGAYSSEDLNNGMGCLLEECVTIDTKENSEVQECVCKKTNTKVKKICMEQIKWRKYDFGFKKSKEVIINENNLLNTNNTHPSNNS